MNIRFIRGLAANYSETTHANAIYFATDTQEIWMNGKSYGFHVEDDWTVDDIIEAAKKVVAADNSVIVNEDGIKVNVKAGDENALKLDKDGLYVDQAALTGYTGKDAIAISEVDVNNVKEVSLVINDTEDVLSQDTDGLKSTIGIKKLTEAEVIALADSNVAEAYKLVGKDGSAAKGDVIKIYKDSSVKEVHIGNPVDPVDPSNPAGEKESAQKLYITYILADGSENKVSVDFSAFVAESEAGKGLEVVDNVLNIKLDANSESEFLAVDKNGLALTGVRQAINDAAAAATTVVSKGASEKFVVVTKQAADPTDGHIEYVITTTDVASDAELTRVEAAVGLAEDGTYVPKTGDPIIGTAASVADAIGKTAEKVQEIATDKTFVKGVTVNGIDADIEENHADVTVSGADIELTGYQIEASPSAILNTDTVNKAIGKLDASLTWIEV